MASPQLEEGHTRIANEILEQSARVNLNGTQFKILLIVWRYTYGFNRKSHELSITFLAEAIGAHEKQTQRELKKLIDRGILIVVKTVKNKNKVLSFEKNYENWKQSKTTNPLPSNLLISCHDINEAKLLIRYPQNNGLVAQRVANPLPKKERKKDIKESNIYRQFNHLSMTVIEYEKLLSEGYSKASIDDTLDLIENYKKNKQYVSLLLTTRVWMKRDKQKPNKQQKNKEQDDILLNFYKEGEAIEANGNGNPAQDDQDRLSLF